MKQETTEDLIDLTTCVFAAHGFALHLTEKIQIDHKRVWSQMVKRTGKAFIEQLEKSVNLIWSHADPEDLTQELGYQQINSYELCESFLRISMKAERTLTPEARQIFEAEHVELLKKWNLIS